jgi:uncharacterized protein
MKTKQIIDAHAHLAYWSTLKECQDNLLKSNKKYKINYSLISFASYEFPEENDSRVRLVQQIIGFNKCAEFIRKYPKQFGMLCWVRPHTENNIKEVENFIINNRDIIYGIKIHPYCSRIKVTDPLLIPYLKLAEKYNLPVLVHTATDKYSKIKYLAEVAKEWPHLNFIAAHAELLSNHKECLKYMLMYKNIFCDTAWVDIKTSNEFIKNGLIDRIIFGTDNPIDGIITLDNKIYADYFNNTIELSQENIEKIMYKNALKIYNINPKVFK